MDRNEERAKKLGEKIERLQKKNERRNRKKMFHRERSSILHLWDGSYRFEADVFNDQKKHFYEQYEKVESEPKLEDKILRLLNMKILYRECEYQVLKDGAETIHAIALIRMRMYLLIVSKRLVTEEVYNLLEEYVDEENVDQAKEDFYVLFNRDTL